MNLKIFGLIAALLVTACGGSVEHHLSSPDKSVQVTFALTAEGSPRYAVTRKGETVLASSKLGVALEDADFTRGLTLVDISAPNRINDSYELLNGKRLQNSYAANEQVFSLVNEKQQPIDVVFRVSDDGVAFRYVFKGESDQPKKLKEEMTSFAFGPDTKAWLQPIAVAQTGFANTNPSYEEHYQMDIPVGTPSPSEAGWVFPALFKAGDTWVLITEAAMNGDYHASRLKPQSPDGEYSLGTPMAPEVYTGGALLAQARLPFESPWRIIALGSLATIVESTLGTDLAEPAIDMDMSFIKPGQASWSWALLKDESVVYDVQKQFIDYAAEMQWEYTLVDVNWDTTIGYEKIEELAQYAASKGVGLLLWYNSSGDWNTTDYHPKSKLLTHKDRAKEFARLQAMGIKGVKVDFFSGDGQSMMQYYNDVIKDAADYRLLVNFHGSSLPRGLQRTYPNLMTMESVRGFEYVTFFQETADLAPSHSAMLPFARNAFDPMDYTPTTFSKIPNIERKTTNGFELAQTVIFLSGIQHIAETPEGMAKAPDYVKAYLQQLPAVWDDTRFVQGYPGKLAVIARRAGDAWYVSGINGEAVDKELQLDLSFIRSKKGYVINDGDTASSFSRSAVAPDSAVKVRVKANGGFAMVFN
jgi:alpha-glucosidase